MAAMRVYLGSDHAGFELKNEIIEHLKKSGHEPIDCGAYTYDAEDDYPVHCIPAAEAVVAEPGSMAIVIGGSGNGEQIAANKVIGTRAALAYNIETAKLGRQHNDANVIAIGARMHTQEQALEMVRTFLDTPFSGDPRHARRIAQLAAYENDRTLPVSAS
jgi:ribose 5-phosphate isomerase B